MSNEITMKSAFWARKAHKWIGLIIGVQALLWMISGVYMTVISWISSMAITWPMPISSRWWHPPTCPVRNCSGATRA
ncbi:MAG: hypothetical protein HZT39_13695 [Pseudoxanthomonas sp.]|nr:MAG: hypothetical protein HZT39_13695 [Pseudoxanthomonas sp.]